MRSGCLCSWLEMQASTCTLGAPTTVAHLHHGQASGILCMHAPHCLDLDFQNFPKLATSEFCHRNTRLTNTDCIQITEAGTSPPLVHVSRSSMAIRVCISNLLPDDGHADSPRPTLRSTGSEEGKHWGDLENCLHVYHSTRQKSSWKEGGPKSNKPEWSMFYPSSSQ